MKTTFATVSIHYLVKLIGCTYGAAFDAMKALNMKGRVVNGTRVWTNAELEAIRSYLGK